MSVFTSVAMCRWIIAFPVLLLGGKDYSGKDLQNRDLRTEDLVGANFENANLTAVNLKEALLQKANFKSANLSRASLDGADMSGADFRDSDWSSLGAQNANLSGANLEGVDLKKASLYRANLRGANLRNAKGIGHSDYADFSGADLRGTYLLEMIDYNGRSAKFKGAKYDRRTRWPKGFDVEGSGAVLTESEENADSKPGNSASSPTAPPAEKQSESKAPVDPNRPKDAPPESVVTAQLEKFWAQEKVKNTFDYKTFKYGKSRIGEYRTDGVPANTQTTVYPLRVVVAHTVEFANGSTRTEERKQTFIFFKDEFDDWTYRFKSND